MTRSSGARPAAARPPPQTPTAAFPVRMRPAAPSKRPAAACRSLAGGMWRAVAPAAPACTGTDACPCPCPAPTPLSPCAWRPAEASRSSSAFGGAQLWAALRGVDKLESEVRGLFAGALFSYTLLGWQEKELPAVAGFGHALLCHAPPTCLHCSASPCTAPLTQPNQTHPACSLRGQGLVPAARRHAAAGRKRPQAGPLPSRPARECARRGVGGV